MSEFTADQYDVLNRLVDALRAEARIEAIWLEGSLARGDADRYSDVDLHAYVPFDHEDSTLARLLSQLPGLLSQAGRIVYLRTLPGTAITTGVLADGSRFDIVLETEEDLKRPRRAFKVIYDLKGEIWSRLRFEDSPPPVKADRVESVLQDFWRCLGLLPAVVARGERIAAFQGHAVMLSYAAEIALAADGVPRTFGGKRLNPYLNPADRDALESVLPESASFREIASAQLRMARIVAERGRVCSKRLGFVYPVELEEAMMRFVSQELARFGLSDVVESSRQEPTR